MKELINKNKNIIISIIIGFFLSGAIIKLFNFKNDYLIYIGTVLFIYLIEKNRSNKNSKRTRIVLSIYSLLISIVLLFQSKINFSGNIHASYLENTFTDFKILDIVRVFILFVPLFLFFNYLYNLFKNSKYSIIKKDKELTKKEKFKFWIISTLVVFIPFFIYLVANYPGFFTIDAVRSIYEGTGRMPLSNHHPVMFTQLVAFIMKVGLFFHSYNFGVFLYSLFQSLCLSMLFGYFAFWLKKHNVSFTVIVFVLIFYISNTLFASQAITMWKDPLFSASIFLLTLYLYDIVKSNGELLKKPLGIIKFITIVLLISFLRNNGIYIVMALFLILLFVYRKQLLKFHIAYLLTIIAVLLIQGPLYDKLDIYSPKEETYAIPMQQIARTIAMDGNINEEQKEFLQQILSIEKWKEKYTPLSVDPVKWDENFNKEVLKANQSKFLKVWLELLPGNFDNYVKAYLMDTYSFWSIGVQSSYGLTGFGTTSNYMNLRRVDVVKNLTGISIAKYFPTPHFLGSGTLLWITILSGALLIILKKSKYIISLLPLLLGAGTILIATPVAFCLRYVLFLAFALPFVVILPFMLKEKK